MPLVASSIGRVYLSYLPAALTGPVLRAQWQDGGAQLSPDEIADLLHLGRFDGCIDGLGGDRFDFLEILFQRLTEFGFFEVRF